MPESLEELLREWLNWWLMTDDLPVKLPNALHVRTAVALKLTELYEPKEAEQ